MLIFNSYRHGGVVQRHPAFLERLGAKPIEYMFYVYLLRNKNGQYYTGYTSDLKRRLREHSNNKVATTSRLRFEKLVYYEAYSSEEAAKGREKKLKQFGSSYKGLIKRLDIK